MLAALIVVTLAALVCAAGWWRTSRALTRSRTAHRAATSGRLVDASWAVPGARP